MPFADTSDTVDSILSSIDLYGPATFSDSATRFWGCVNRLRANHRPALVLETSNRTLQWLFSRWRPGIIRPLCPDLSSLNKHSESARGNR